MIKLELDPTDVRVLRISASYLLALAGDISTEIVGADKPVKVEVTERVGDVSQTVTKTYGDGTVAIGVHPLPDSSPTFNTAELAEAAVFAESITVEGTDVLQPDAATIFGGKPNSALDTVGADTSLIAPVVTTDTVQPNVPTPPVPNPGAAASTAVLPSANHVEVDARGLPWDARIHSRERTKIKNGNWKTKKNVDETLVEAVEGELRGVMSAPVVTAAIPLPSTLTPPVPTGNVNTVPSSEPVTVASFLREVTAAIGAQKITAGQVAAIAAEHGVASLQLVATRPELLPQIKADFDLAIGGV